jgi:uncharacterized lipoprotein YajG
MKLTFKLIALLIILLMLAACGTTGDTRNDAEAAQQLQPNITGYTKSNADSLIDALTAAGAGASLTSGNVPAAAAITKAEAVVQCLQDRGAADASMYIETSPASIIPEAGVSIVINQTRVNQNLLSCLTTGQTEEITAQALTIEPCTANGNFKYKGDDFTYIYVGVGNNLCGFFAQHFASVSAGN